MTWSDFNKSVLAYINRTATGLTFQSYDLILDAVNMAQMEAQRKRNFKYLRDVGFIQASLTGIDMSTAMFTTPGGPTQIKPKKIESVWLYAGVGASYLKARRVPAMTVGDSKLYYPVGDQRDWLNNPNVPNWQVTDLKWYMKGSKVYIIGGAPTGTSYLYCDIIKYLDDLTGSNTNFLLDYGHDWLKFKTLLYLNAYLKEDQRVLIGTNLLDAAWTSLCSWDDDVAEGAFDIDEND